MFLISLQSMFGTGIEYNGCTYYLLLIEIKLNTFGLKRNTKKKTKTNSERSK